MFGNSVFENIEKKLKTGDILDFFGTNR